MRKLGFYIKKNKYFNKGSIAQQVERLTVNQKATGSKPVRTAFKNFNLIRKN